ncbi:MAG: hypothetical protein U0992_09460 [Planctomycetaceae bacterium]
MTFATSSDAGFIGSGTGSASGNPLAASADFSYSAGTLTITLKNTSTFDYASSPSTAKAVPTDILTALFFDYNGGFGPSMTLTLATAPAVTVGSNPSTLVVPPTSGGWEYQESASSLSGITQHYGLGTAGFGVFNGNATNLPTPAWQYGIINSKYVDGEGNPSVNGSILAKDSITFTFSCNRVRSMSRRSATSAFSTERRSTRDRSKGRTPQ